MSESLVVVDGEVEPSEVAYDGLPAKQRAFLMALPECGTVQAAAAQIGISRRLVYWWSASNNDFAAALNDAQEAVADRIEKALFDRAIQGNQAWDTTAGIFLLKGKRPMYRDSFTVTTKSLNITADIADLPIEERAALLQLALRQESRALPSSPAQQDDDAQ